ncbi:uncharacterized protein B4U79_18098 [Dinothrombium tinctorium]|uniref:RING-CH-type domain-containing protein n=1 Tax=Dinothrombium tinctorium TaxID=1965070 RepID=A0A3S3S3S4_9ACAR|nr:uncharacterized protein B4U79_18098 [Dinothrombium tinctorium]
MTIEHYACCAFCLKGDKAVEQKLFKLCNCAGSNSFTHEQCLNSYIQTTGIGCCPMCGFQFKVNYLSKNFLNWIQEEPEELYDFYAVIIICAMVGYIINIGTWYIYSNAAYSVITLLSFAFGLIAFLGKRVQVYYKWKNEHSKIQVEFESKILTPN